DVPGVRVDGAVQPALDAGDVETLIELGAATDGMTVKLRAAVAALRAGARAARIGDVHMLGHPSAGTRVLGTAAQPACAARPRRRTPPRGPPPRYRTSMPEP